MTRSGKTTRLARIAAAGMLVMICAAFGMYRITPLLSVLNVQQNSLPTDPQPTCVVTPTMFASWFHSGAPTLNGLVDPANSVYLPEYSQLLFLSVVGADVSVAYFARPGQSWHTGV
jgi:hypothetical protein